MKKNILTLVFILYVFLAFSQDKIYKLDGTEVLANIKEVNQTEIKYNKFSNADGPLYTIEKSEVLMIVYANGETEIFAKKKKAESPVNVEQKPVDYEKLEQNEKYKNFYGRNIFSVNFATLVFKDLNISYERSFGRQKVAIKIPLYIGYSTEGKRFSNSFSYFSSPKELYNEKHAIVSGVITGIHLKIYPTGEGLIRGFMFLGAEGGGVTIKSTSYDYYVITNNARSYNTNIGYVGGTIGGGISYQPLKILNCTLDAGISGGAYPDAGRIVYKGGSLPIRIGLSVGVRF